MTHTFRPNIAYLYCWDITPEVALAQAEEHLDIGKRVTFLSKMGDLLDLKAKVCPLEGSVQSLLKLTHIVTRPGSEDAIAVSVMNSILGGGAFPGRLMQNLREDKAFTTELDLQLALTH